MVILLSANYVYFGWIDHWNLILDKRLSYIWYPHTSHISMFNECLIYLCDCTWLNVLYVFNQMLVKHKKIFEFFSCFWKVFLFWKISENPKFYNPVFGNSLVSHASEVPVMSLLRRFCDSLASEIPSREKYLEKFSKFLGFGHFCDSFSQLCHEWKL